MFNLTWAKALTAFVMPIVLPYAENAVGTALHLSVDQNTALVGAINGILVALGVYATPNAPK